MLKLNSNLSLPSLLALATFTTAVACKEPSESQYPSDNELARRGEIFRSRGKNRNEARYLLKRYSNIKESFNGRFTFSDYSVGTTDSLTKNAELVIFNDKEVGLLLKDGKFVPLQEVDVLLPKNHIMIRGTFVNQSFILTSNGEMFSSLDDFKASFDKSKFEKLNIESLLPSMINIANGNRSKVNATNKFQFKQIDNQNEIDQNIIFNFRTSLETLEQIPFKSKQTYWVLNKENIIALCNSLYPSGYSIDYNQLPNGTMNYILKPKKSLYTTF